MVNLERTPVLLIAILLSGFCAVLEETYQTNRITTISCYSANLRRVKAYYNFRLIKVTDTICYRIQQLGNSGISGEILSETENAY